MTLRTLRFYEDKGLLSPKRDGTTRLYTRRDVARLKLILLGRKVGFSLREVKQMMDLYDPAGSNTKQLKLALEKSEKQLGRLEKQRVAIDEAISELTRSIDSRSHACWRSASSRRPRRPDALTIARPAQSGGAIVGTCAAKIAGPRSALPGAGFAVCDRRRSPRADVLRRKKSVFARLN